MSLRLAIVAPRMHGSLAALSQERATRQEPFPLLTLFKELPQMWRALASFHGADLVHGDIKLDNLLVSKDGNIKLNDMGSVKLAAQEGEAAPVSP